MAQLINSLHATSRHKETHTHMKLDPSPPLNLHFTKPPNQPTNSLHPTNQRTHFIQPTNRPTVHNQPTNPTSSNQPTDPLHPTNQQTHFIQPTNIPTQIHTHHKIHYKKQTRGKVLWNRRTLWLILSIIYLFYPKRSAKPAIRNGSRTPHPLNKIKTTHSPHNNSRQTTFTPTQLKHHRPTILRIKNITLPPQNTHLHSSLHFTFNQPTDPFHPNNQQTHFIQPPNIPTSSNQPICIFGYIWYTHFIQPTNRPTVYNQATYPLYTTKQQTHFT